ncbi:glycosyltransferase family 9 protein [Acidicapsa acidisoli]|uniref:glycosyltransferase family 9 protein n=1 Tax=Acidicapsa acidisoli TaxID=1615681 RepID=UPI0021DF4318|nr:glycosyltransferase family 9 protein [Acidicapsa acidisoli]
MKRGKATNRLVDFYLGIPVLNSLATVRRKRSLPRNPVRIGLLFNPALGDTLLASAVVQDIRALYPNGKLILFATTANAAAARLLPEIDAIETLPITRPLEAVRMLRRSRLDLMLDFSAWQRITALYTLLSGAKFTAGFERRKQYRHRGYDKTVPHQGDCHELENLRRLTRSLGAIAHAAPRLKIPDVPLPEVFSQTEEVILFHPWASGAKSWLREWPEENWAGLARELMAPGRSILITGAPSDEPRCQTLSRRLAADGIAVQILIGRTGIGEVACVLKRAKMLISVNTGIMHLGAILGTPTISINGPTSAERWGPIGPRVANVCPPDGSGGFLDLGFEYRGRPTDVMNKISVVDVMCAVNSYAQLRLAPS